MKSFRQLIRLIYINYILAKNGLDQLIVTIGLFSWFRFVVFLNPWNWFRRNQLSRGAALRISLEELGPIFVKFGQALSTRPDILPPDIAMELCKLQDKVPPFPSAKMLEIVESAFGRPVSDIFESFDTAVLASASIAQVHAATLKSGEDVVVKVLRPNIHKVIKQDLGILHTIAVLADRYWPESKRFKPKEIVREFENSLLDELDLQREAANAGQLRRNFTDSPLLYIPEVYWDYVRENVLVMERIYGIPVTDVSTLKAYNIDIKKLAERGIEIFFTQVFRDCFFHADMHPGNIFVSYEHPENPQYICIDFGIIGTLSDRDKRYLAENLVAFFNRDYHRVAKLHIESGWVARDTRVEDFEMAIRTVCEPIFEKPLKDISFALVVVQLFQVARRFHMEVQPQLVLLQKTLLAVEGLGRQLYPELDLWTTAKPFLEDWLRAQMGPKKFLKNLRENLPFFIDELPHLPRLVNEVLALSKEEKIRRLERMDNNNLTRSMKNSWYRGLGFGIFWALMTFAGIAYLDLLTHEKLIVFAVSSALAGGMIALLQRKNHNGS
ncbi:ubiquinone biosynthesis regulatory protein kinase UbiB [Legionella londiniensis]|uniref:Probable protein kinase UbiB n=1 Tax=Legionella londiniensis TaxID=45068 RepID=A0A0W0VI40_9GAMM|nr:ubiquinone biosynthesis regulatory protein kinase UbiB [Legionella londiniensis]KTD19781.1 ubiquinone biosynthesis AarF [Legionella londiniensis]STX92308.1 ubiquinone biosynthesis protein [Legionella londiniensis]